MHIDERHKQDVVLFLVYSIMQLCPSFYQKHLTLSLE
jgi:hypothetical protein